MSGEKTMALFLKSMMPKELFEGIEQAKKNIGDAITNFDHRLSEIEKNQILQASLLRAVAVKIGVISNLEAIDGSKTENRIHRNGRGNA